MFPWDQSRAGFCGRMFPLIPRQQFAFGLAVVCGKRSTPNDFEPVQHFDLLLPVGDRHRESFFNFECWQVAAALRRPCSRFLIVSTKFPNHRDSGGDRADQRETDREDWQHGDFARAISSTKIVNVDV